MAAISPKTRAAIKAYLEVFIEHLVIGQEFWEIVGGPTAFEELLAIYQEVGHDKSKYMLDALAFGF